jgi:hypothetical protein
MDGVCIGRVGFPITWDSGHLLSASLGTYLASYIYTSLSVSTPSEFVIQFLSLIFT